MIAGGIAIVVALVIMAVISSAIIREAVIHKHKDIDLKIMAEIISNTIDNGVDRGLDAAKILSSDYYVKKWIESDNEDIVSREIVREKMRQMVKDLGYETAYIASSVNNEVWSYSNKSFERSDILSANNPEDAWFFNSIKRSDKIQISMSYDKRLKSTFIWIETLIESNGKNLGVSGIGIKIDTVINSLIQEDSHNHIKNDIWLIDKEGIICISKNKDDLEMKISDFLPDNVLDELNNPESRIGEFGITEYRDKLGETYDLVYKRIDDTDWRMAIQIGRSESIGFLKDVIINTAVAGIFIIAIVLVLFNLLSRKIADPYKHALLLNQELENKINERTKELDERNTKIQDSIEYAKRILDTILPPKELMDNILKDYFVIWETRDIVGGDFYWVHGFNDGYLLIVGDCTGHGVPGALMTAAVISTLNSIADDIRHDDPKEILKELDRHIYKAFKQDCCCETISDGLDAGVLFVSKKNEILFSGAKISVFVSDKNGTYEIKGSKFTIDCLNSRREKIFENHRIEYSEGLTLYFATDGVFEQPGGKKGLPLGKERLTEALEFVKTMSMENQKDYLTALYKDYCMDEIVRDDVTLLGIRIRK